MPENKRRLYVDMDGVLCDFDKAYKEKFIEGKVEYPQSQARFFENLEIIEDAYSSMAVLINMFDLWILTAPSVINPNCYTEKRVWIEEHFGRFELQEKLIICPDKSLLK